MNIYEKMGPTHNNKNGPGGPKKGGSVNITTAVAFSFNTINKPQH